MKWDFSVDLVTLLLPLKDGFPALSLNKGFSPKPEMERF